RRHRQTPGDPHRTVARDRSPSVELQRKRSRRRVIEQRCQLEVEFGIDPKQQSHNKRERKRNEKSGPAHGAGGRELNGSGGGGVSRRGGSRQAPALRPVIIK